MDTRVQAGDLMPTIH